MDLKTLSLKDLIEGQESATQLHTILQDILPLLKSGSASTAATLMTRILSSFSRPISLLEVHGMLEGLPNTRVSDERRLDASSDKRKLHQPGKGGYRRRAHPCTNTRVVSETMDDGHVWRKYGQKNICTSKFPRSYYRCGHKYDRGCQATRQVQRSEEDPSMFVITYMGQHACVGGSTSPSPPSPCVISFGSNAVQEKSFPSPIPSRDEEVPNDSTPWTSPTELIFPDFPIYFDSVSTAATSGCHASADSLNLEFNPEALEFGGVFCFGQGEPLHQI